MPGISTGTLEKFFAIMAGRADKSIFRLIQSYAEQDAVAAFRVASPCKIDIFTRLPHVVIGNADQPAFRAILLERATRERDNRWANVFGEAGLRSAAVANALSQGTSRIWHQDVEAIPRRNRWFLKNYIDQSPFTECLSLACKAENLDQDVFPLVNLLRHITPPGNRRIDLTIRLGSSLFFAMIGIIYLSVAISLIGLLFFHFTVFNIIGVFRDIGWSYFLDHSLLVGLLLPLIMVLIQVCEIAVSARQNMYSSLLYISPKTRRYTYKRIFSLRLRGAGFLDASETMPWIYRVVANLREREAFDEILLLRHRLRVQQEVSGPLTAELSGPEVKL